MGNYCEDVCPEGYYGLHCIESCQCKSDKFVCHVKEGCVCRQGFRGENCDEAVVGRLVDGTDSAGEWTFKKFIIEQEIRVETGGIIREVSVLVYFWVPFYQ